MFARLLSLKKACIVLITLLSVVLLGLTVKGDKGQDGAVLAYQNKHDKSQGGPFELTNSTARYALVEAIVENNSFSLNDSQASFASPDLVYYNNKFYSIFTPGISFIGVPFYILGKQFGIPQLMTYMATALFTLLNFGLVAYIARKLHVNIYASLLGGFLFTFATNALIYTHSFTQHSFSTAMILLAVINAMGKRTWLKNILFGVIVGIAALIDIPNIFLLTPIGLYILAKHVDINKKGHNFIISAKLSFIAILLGLLPFLAVFGWYNYQTTESYTKLGQTIGRTNYEKAIEERTKPAHQKKDAKSDDGSYLPFNTRTQIHGAYTLLISNERAWIYYSPIVLVGFLGIFSFYQKGQVNGLIGTLVGVIMMNIILYTMFGDPWGGWAFGPRYLIPAAGVLSVFMAVAFDRYGKNILFSLLFTLLAFYSIFVTITGTITTSAIPPKVEAVNMVVPIPYTYEYNIQLLEEGKMSSLAYNVWFSSLSPNAYLISLSAMIAFATLVLQSMSIYQVRKEATHHAGK